MKPAHQSNLRRIASILLLSLFVSVIVVSQTNEASGQFVTVKGTRVTIVPPTGFTPAPQHPGFWQESTSSLIVVSEFPAPLAELSSGFSNAAELQKRGMALLSQQELKAGKQNGLLMHLEQKALGAEYRKWLLIFGDDKESVIVTATFPRQLEDNLSEKMKASVLTARWDREKKVAPTEGLNFTFNETGDLKLAKRIANVLLFTKSGNFPSKDIDDPVLVIGQALSKVDVDDKEEFAKSRLSQTATINDVEIEQLTQVTIDNLTGYEITAKGKDKASSQPVVIYQVVLFEDQTYYIIQGIVSGKHRQAYLPIFKEMAGTFQRKK